MVVFLLLLKPSFYLFIFLKVIGVLLNGKIALVAAFHRTSFLAANRCIFKLLPTVTSPYGVLG